MSIRLYTVSYSLYVFLGYTASKGFWTEWKDMPKNKNVKFLTKTKQKESALTQRNQFVLLRFGVLDDLGTYTTFLVWKETLEVCSQCGYWCMAAWFIRIWVINWHKKTKCHLFQLWVGKYLCQNTSLKSDWKSAYSAESK